MLTKHPEYAFWKFCDTYLFFIATVAVLMAIVVNLALPLGNLLAYILWFWMVSFGAKLAGESYVRDWKKIEGL